MNIKKLKIIGIIIAFLLTFPLHFLYDKLPCFLTSIIAPVNESIWEHMKILFGAILISGIIEKIIVKTKKLNINNVFISNFLSALISIPIFLIMFMPVYNIIGKNFVITIIIMLLAIIIAKIMSYVIMKKKNLNLQKITIIFVIAIYIIFGLLTYFPPKNNLFLDPIKNIYGIQNKNN